MDLAPPAPVASFPAPFPERMSDAFVALDARGCCTYVNAAAAALSACRPEDLLGKPVSSLFPEAVDGPLPLAVEGVLRTRRPVQVEVPYPPRDRRYVCRVQPSPQGVEIFLSDPLASGNGGQESRESQARLKTVFESPMFGLLFWNAKGEISDANEAFLALVGYTREDLRAGRLRWRDLTPPEQAGLDDQALRDVARQGSCAPYEKDYIRKDGSRVPVLIGRSLVTREPLSGVAFVLDLTDRRRAEAAARRSEELFRQLAENIDEIFWIASPDLSAIHYLSPAFERIFGCPREKLYADPSCWPEFVHPEDRERVMKAAAERIPAGTYDVQFRLVTPDGTERWVWERSFVLRDASGRMERVAGFMEDITTLKRAELALQDRIRRQSLLAALGRVAVGDSPVPALLEQALLAVTGGLGLSRVQMLELLPADAGMILRAGLGWTTGLVGSLQLPCGPGTLYGHALRSPTPVATEDVSAELRFTCPEVLRRHGAVGGLLVALGKEDRRWGILAAFSTSPRHFAEEDLHFIESIGHLLGDALQRRAREAELRESRDRITEDLDRSRDRIQMLEEQTGSRSSLGHLVGSSAAMQEVYRRIRLAAPSDVNVLMTGESGTGKELAAAAIHGLSARGSGPFVGVNCSAIPEALLESEIFGHVKGAFTGAYRDKVGLFELADRGTLLLDEVGDMSPLLQVKILRALQERRIRRVGGEEFIPIDTRIIAATNRKLPELLLAGTLREDFYYRIKVFEIRMPPLRERREDIPLLVEAFIADLSKTLNRDLGRIAPAALQALMGHAWPGNVRELRNAIEHALVISPGKEITAKDLPVEILARTPALILQEDVRRDQITRALKSTRWNRTLAAKLLKVSRVTLWKHMRRLEIRAPDSSP